MRSPTSIEGEAPGGGAVARRGRPDLSPAGLTDHVSTLLSCPCQGGGVWMYWRCHLVVGR